ncbi:MAG: hypothetical protein NZ920_00750 [Aigarchaeota archaeon]|nr:hypothetical protein [Aigarchaeota archaeon]MDW8092971.1 RING finger protein [Nitrososphaerota archaeon]
MMTSVAEARYRLSRIAALLSILGALHVLSLLLNWYVVSYQNLEIQVITGYLLNESMLISLIAGALAGASGVLAVLYSNFSWIRIAVPAMGTVAGALALGSSLYSYLIKMPSFRIEFVPQIGFLSALFSGGGLFAMGLLAVIIVSRTRVERQTHAWGRPQTLSYDMHEEVTTEPETITPLKTLDREQPMTTQYLRSTTKTEGTQCIICYDKTVGGEVAECPSCGATFHKDCIDSWIDLGGSCPSCGAAISKE